MNAARHPPDLAAPGAGVPWWQRLGGKYLLLPAYCRRLTWEGVPDLLDSQGTRLLGQPADLSEEQLTRRVLVPRQIGLEDSSRFYSYGMVLDHLTIIGHRVAGIVVELSRSRVPPGRVRTADLKPTGEAGYAESAERYRSMLVEFRRATHERSRNRNSDARYEHPWFGPLDCYQWLCFAPFHQTIHLKQARRVLERLSSR